MARTASEEAEDDVPEPPEEPVSRPGEPMALVERAIRNSSTSRDIVLGATGVGLAPGAPFGAGGEGHLRLCFAATLPTLELALDRLAEFLTSG